MNAFPKESKKKLTREALAALERIYLRAAGWRECRYDPDSWHPPENWPFRKRFENYRTGHALNAQKLADGQENAREVRAGRAAGLHPANPFPWGLE